MPGTLAVKLFFVAGESSSDLHGANLIRALRAQDPNVECEGLGGVRMQQAGMLLRHDLAERAIMGFVEVVRSLGFIRRVYRDTVERLRVARPDALVLIDYPGFNLRLAKTAHAMGIPIVYYISPQIWAWKKGRIDEIRRYVRKMLVILPFEEKLYEEADVPCEYVGHPLMDHIDSLEPADDFAGPCTIGVMPGSRGQEIRRILPVMLDVARGIRERHPEARFVTPCVDEERAAQTRAIAGDFPLEVVTGRMYDVLHGARFCLVASGTATVETALFQVPMIVMYKAAPLSVWLARKLVDKSLPAIAMVNILAGKHIVPEFIQGEATVDAMLPRALELIDDSPQRAETIAALRGIRTLLKGGASDNAAREILAVAREAAYAG